jgi:glucose-1-phosphate cytidylyltransferase
MTYGDGLSNIDIAASIAFHEREGRLATVTAVHPPGRYGTILRDAAAPTRVAAFEEKPPGDGNLINGGFFVLSPEVLPWIDGDATIWEQEPMQRLATAGQMSAFAHEGFWQPMDTLRERNQLEDLWVSGAAPWKRW